MKASKEHGMDQHVSQLPKPLTNSKAMAATTKLPTHITGAIVHGRGQHTFIDCNEIPHDSNLTINVLIQVRLNKNIVLNFVMCVVQDYASVQMTYITAESVFKIVDLFNADDIPLDNLVSSLSDSTAYMQGKRSGFETRLREVAQNLVDIDGDIYATTITTV